MPGSLSRCQESELRSLILVQQVLYPLSHLPDLGLALLYAICLNGPRLSHLVSTGIKTVLLESGRLLCTVFRNCKRSHVEVSHSQSICSWYGAHHSFWWEQLPQPVAMLYFTPILTSRLRLDACPYQTFLINEDHFLSKNSLWAPWTFHVFSLIMKKNVEHGRAKDKRKLVRDDPKGCRVYYYSLDMFS